MISSAIWHVMDLPSDAGSFDMTHTIVRGSVNGTADWLRTEICKILTPLICISLHLHQSVIRRYDNCVSNYRPTATVSQVEISFVLETSETGRRRRQVQLPYFRRYLSVGRGLRREGRRSFNWNRHQGSWLPNLVDRTRFDVTTRPQYTSGNRSRFFIFRTLSA